jgi:predicted DNA binding protein
LTHDLATMARDRTHQATPDLFSTDMVRDASSPPTRRVSAMEAATDTASKRHVLPNDLPNAVKYLTDRELDLLITASVEEAKRRGRLLPSISPNSTDESVRKQSPSKDQRQAEVAKISLTRGQVNAVRAALKAGIKPSQIARQFGISQSDVRKVLASDTATQRVT